MAEQCSRGWIWTSEEKTSAKKWKTLLERRIDEVRRQASTIQQFLPALASEVKEVSQAFLAAAHPITAIDLRAQGRKYQPLSPEEAAIRLATIAQHFASWIQFCKREDVQHAWRQVEQAHQELNALAEEERQRRIALLDDPRPNSVDQKLDELLSYVRALILISKLPQTERVERYVHLSYIRVAIRHILKPESVDAIKVAIQVQPPLPLPDLLRLVTYHLMKHSLTVPDTLQRAYTDKVVLAFGAVADGIHLACKDEPDRKLLCERIAQGDPQAFSLYGIDYSGVDVDSDPS